MMMEYALFFLMGALLSASLLYPISAIIWRRARAITTEEFRARLPLGGLDIQAMIDLEKATSVLRETELNYLLTTQENILIAQKRDNALHCIENAEIRQEMMNLRHTLSKRHQDLQHIEALRQTDQTTLKAQDVIKHSLSKDISHLKRDLKTALDEIISLRISLRKAHKARIQFELETVQHQSIDQHHQQQNTATAEQEIKQHVKTVSDLYNELTNTQSALINAQNALRSDNQTLRHELKMLSASIRQSTLGNAVKPKMQRPDMQLLANSNVVQAAEKFLTKNYQRSASNDVLQPSTASETTERG